VGSLDFWLPPTDQEVEKMDTPQQKRGKKVQVVKFVLIVALRDL
jgi:hypothetical protein